MAPRVSPTEAIRAEIHELFACDGELLSVIEQLARLSVRLTFQSVIEEIICEELGRGRYQRRTGDSPEGYRNGWQQPRTLKTSLGPVQLQRPKLRHAHAGLCDSSSGRASRGRTRWSPWSSPAACGACRTATSRPCSPRSSASRRRSAARPSAGSASGCGRSWTRGSAATCPAPRKVHKLGRVR